MYNSLILCWELNLEASLATTIVSEIIWVGIKSSSQLFIRTLKSSAHVAVIKSCGQIPVNKSYKTSLFVIQLQNSTFSSLEDK